MASKTIKVLHSRPICRAEMNKWLRFEDNIVSSIPYVQPLSHECSYRAEARKKKQIHILRLIGARNKACRNYVPLLVSTIGCKIEHNENPAIGLFALIKLCTVKRHTS
jgi:hypothetical protein